MKKLKFILAVMFSFVTLNAMAIDYEGVYDNYQVVFSPSSNTFSTGAMAEDRIVLTKHTTAGTGSYSQYTYNCKKPCNCPKSKCKCNHDKKIQECKEINLKSNFEFVYGAKLIGVDNENLKFNEIIYKDNGFVEKPLTYEEVQKIFSDVEVIKISDFKKNTYTILSSNEEKTILLYNDTDDNFHKYFVNPEQCAGNKDIKALINLPKKGKVYFSHIGDKKLKSYTIKVK